MIRYSEMSLFFEQIRVLANAKTHNQIQSRIWLWKRTTEVLRENVEADKACFHYVSMARLAVFSPAQRKIYFCHE
jgi:hypothetical protein